MYGTTTTVQLHVQCTTIQLTTAEVQLSASHVRTAEYSAMKFREWLEISQCHSGVKNMRCGRCLAKVFLKWRKQKILAKDLANVKVYIYIFLYILYI